MEWTKELLQMPLLCGSLFFAGGMIMYLFPPKKINRFYGYRTSSSMKSDERWHFAQNVSSIKMMQSGVFVFLMSFFGFIIPKSVSTNSFLGIGIILAAVFYVLFTTEKQLKIKFPKD